MKKFLDHPFLNSLSKHTDILVAGLVLVIIALIIIPLPSFLLDLLLSLNIGISVIVLLISIFSKSVLDFSVFPTLLLVTTLFRLGLNVSSTRLILSTGDPGAVVEAFGSFVTQGDMVVGTVIFVIICIVQFLVITNGSSRVAEVSARFALDAMPGKQMSIDADLNNGLITDAQAKLRREEIQKEAGFYGSMDGASKFVKGDAVAGIIIVLINFIGGIIIFSLKGYEVMEAIEKFGILTIGDGLVSQVPALLISIASGIIVTRSPSEDNIGKDLSKQLVSFPKAVAIAAIVLGIFGLVPGLPVVPFMGMAILIGFVAYLLFEGEKTQAKNERLQSTGTIEKSEPIEESRNADIASYLNVEVFEIELGYGLVSMVNGDKANELLDRIYKIRKQIIQELGLFVPALRLRDNFRLGENEYVVKIKGDSIGSGVIYPEKYFVISPTGEDIPLDGIDSVCPTFGLDAKWVDEKLKTKAENLGFNVVDDLTVLLTHLKAIIEVHGHEFLDREELKSMLDIVKEKHPTIIEELIPNILPVSSLLRILKNLLREGVSIREMDVILALLAEYAPNINNTEQLTELVRAGISRKLIRPYLNNEGGIDVLMVDMAIQEKVQSSLSSGIHGTFAVLDPDAKNAIYMGVQTAFNTAMIQQKSPVILVSSSIRPAFKKLIEGVFPQLPVLSTVEIPSTIVMNQIERVVLR